MFPALGGVELCSGTYRVSARMSCQLGCERDGSAEEENVVEHVDHDHDDRVEGPVHVE